MYNINIPIYVFILNVYVYALYLKPYKSNDVLNN